MSAINHEYEHVFIHVPKVAGTSMECKPFVGGCGHETATFFRDNYKEYDEYFSWGFVRNPFERLVSIHSAIFQHPDHCKVRDVVPKDFKEFVRKLNELSFVHIYSQHVFLCDGDGKIIVDFVGRYEFLQQDWYRVCKYFGVGLKRLANKNKTDHKPWMEYYDSETLEIVNNHYRRDFEIFGYSSLLKEVV